MNISKKEHGSGIPEHLRKPIIISLLVMGVSLFACSLVFLYKAIMVVI